MYACSPGIDTRQCTPRPVVIATVLCGEVLSERGGVCACVCAGSWSTTAEDVSHLVRHRPGSFNYISGVLPEKAMLDIAGVIKVNLRVTYMLWSFESGAPPRGPAPRAPASLSPADGRACAYNSAAHKFTQLYISAC